jgi:hypothetical protein
VPQKKKKNRKEKKEKRTTRLCWNGSGKAQGTPTQKVLLISGENLT